MSDIEMLLRKGNRALFNAAAYVNKRLKKAVRHVGLFWRRRGTESLA